MLVLPAPGRAPLVATALGRPDQTSPGAGGCAGSAEHEVLRPVVTATYWVDPGGRGMPYKSVIRFTGRRMGVAGRPSPADRFEHDETVYLVPGSGPVAVTTRAENVNAGEWLVRARPAAGRARSAA